MTGVQGVLGNSPEDPQWAGEGLRRMRLERQALDRAGRYAAVDPYYDGQLITDREQALMHLALRAYTFPGATEVAILELRRKQQEAAT